MCVLGLKETCDKARVGIDRNLRPCEKRTQKGKVRMCKKSNEQKLLLK